MAEPAMLPVDIRHKTPLSGPAEHFEQIPLSEFEVCDCVFSTIHGTGGEDGAFQGLLRLLRLPFTGSDVLASAQAYNKWTTKQLARSAGLPVTPAIHVEPHESPQRIRKRIEADLRCWDLVVKPTACGSSFGVSRISCPSQLPAALSAAFAFDATAIVEHYVRHTELYMAVLGNSPRPLVARPVIDPDPKESPSTYFDKYIDDKHPLRCPAGLDAGTEQRARDLALAAYELLGCSGFARVDLFLCRDTGRILLNEINTIPALAIDCAFSLGMAAEGWTYPAVLDDIVASALIGSGRDRRTILPKSVAGVHDQPSVTSILASRMSSLSR
jgi:D-alanine-D-alanine ligase